VPQIVEKIVQVVHENTKVEEVEKVVDKIVEVTKNDIHTEKEYVIQEKIVEVPTKHEVVVTEKETVK
jgi:predicted S18 family serine protease